MRTHSRFGNSPRRIVSTAVIFMMNLSRSYPVTLGDGITLLHLRRRSLVALLGFFGLLLRPLLHLLQRVLLEARRVVLDLLDRLLAGRFLELLWQVRRDRREKQDHGHRDALYDHELHHALVDRRERPVPDHL